MQTTTHRSDAEGDLKSLSLQELQAKLGSSPAGLTQAEAQLRLAHYGYNEISEKKINPLIKFLSYFWGPIPWMIEAAVILSALVRHWPDFFIILVLLLANAVVGFWEEYRRATPSLPLRPGSRSRPGSVVTESGPRRRRVSWCRATSSACASAISCRQTRACLKVTPLRSISPR